MGGAVATGAILTQSCAIIPSHVWGRGPNFVSPNEKLNIAIIGAGGRGFDDAKGVASENIVALCDVDQRRAARAFRANPRAKRYTDFRVMLDKETGIDAVIIATPDHTHAVATAAAIHRGLHVYTEKPLTHTIHEARTLRKLAARYGVVTQMGNQGTANDGLRQAVEIVQSGGIGDVTEVHVWTNRPIWPQAIERPSESADVPSTMDWDLWLSVAPERPYHKSYAPFKWRGWKDFGTGALGDMACHTANMAFMALNLHKTYPTSIEARTGERFAETYPEWSVIRYEFPARGKMPPLTYYWHDGGKLPPAELAPGIEFSDSGSLLVGSKGTLYSPDDYAAEFKLLPEEDFEDYEPPTPWLPRSPGHHEEWILACKGEGPGTMSNFDYAAKLTETILLGNVALQAGHQVDWDGRRMRFTNCSAANDFVHREYRAGYSLDG